MFKVAIANRNILGKNGASRIILEQAKRFKDAGAEVYLYVSRYDKNIIPKGINIQRFFSLNPFKQARRKDFALKFKDVCNKLKIDLSVGNGDTFDQKVLFMHNLVELELKFVQKKENYSLDNTFLIHDEILRKNTFELLICNSNLMKVFIQQKYKIEDKKIAVIYPGFDPLIFNTKNKKILRKQFKERYNILTEYIVGFVTSGNLKKRGIDVFFDMLTLLPKDLISKITFVVVGKEKNFDLYLSKYKEFARNIIYIKPTQAIEFIIKSLDILVHPALLEEFGMVLLEAMACGVPVITSNMVGASELYLNNTKELVLKNPTPIDFANVLVDLLNNPQKLDNLSSNFEKIAMNYTWDNYFKILFDVYASKGLIPKDFIKT